MTAVPISDHANDCPKMILKPILLSITVILQWNSPGEPEQVRQTQEDVFGDKRQVTRATVRVEKGAAEIPKC